MHAVWGKDKGTRSWNILIFLGSEFYGGYFGNISNFDRHRTSDLELSDFWRFSKVLSCVSYEVCLICNFLRLFQIWSSKIRILCWSWGNSSVSLIYMTIYNIFIVLLFNNHTRYDIFELQIWNKRKKLHIKHTSYDTQLRTFENLQKSDSSKSEVRWRSKLKILPKYPP